MTISSKHLIYMLHIFKIAGVRPTRKNTCLYLIIENIILLTFNIFMKLETLKYRIKRNRILTSLNSQKKSKVKKIKNQFFRVRPTRTCYRSPVTNKLSDDPNYLLQLMLRHSLIYPVSFNFLFIFKYMKYHDKMSDCTSDTHGIARVRYR